ncbi:hypothetical protein FRC17_007784 [Serendipita sp. 399]|nr:hypothetical protein FRC17_007784 [Serendipita sp. 399]
MRFSIFATILATAATLAVAIPIDTTGSSSSVAPVGEPAKPEHSTLALKDVNEGKLVQHKSHKEAHHTPEETEGETSEANHEKKEHHPQTATLVRRVVDEAQAKDLQKTYKSVEKAHQSAAGAHMTTAALNPADAATHIGLAGDHTNAAAKARHLHEGYGHLATAYGHDNKAAAARTQATRDHHTQQAANSRASAAASFHAANQIQAGF